VGFGGQRRDVAAGEAQCRRAFAPIDACTTAYHEGTTVTKFTNLLQKAFFVFFVSVAPS
jgi:hypothetical protein